jgi:hypothetical protein
MRHGFMNTMLKQKLNHHNGCQKGHHDRKKRGKCGQTLKSEYFANSIQDTLLTSLLGFLT